MHTTSTRPVANAVHSSPASDEGTLAVTLTAAHQTLDPCTMSTGLILCCKHKTFAVDLDVGDLQTWMQPVASMKSTVRCHQASHSAETVAIDR